MNPSIMPVSSRLTRNNFDLLRVLFALTVCLVHAHVLSGYRELGWIQTVLSSDIAVQAFFVVSGFLIFMSYERSSSLRSYLDKRVRRIYPAYATIVLLCAFGLWTVSSLSIEDYFSPAWLKYVGFNLAFLNFVQPSLPGVFEGHEFDAVNGALWTLKIEVMFYAAVPVLVYLFRRLGRLPVIAAVYFLSLGYAAVMNWQAQRTGAGIWLELGRQLPGQLSYFMAGAFIYYFLPLFERRVGYFVAFAAAVFVARGYVPTAVFEPLALAILVAFFGLYQYAGNFGKYGDFSYGIYIIHFPLIQIALHFGVFSAQPWLYLIFVVSATLFGAMLMWHLVEKRFLLRNNHYVAAVGADGTPYSTTDRVADRSATPTEPPRREP